MRELLIATNNPGKFKEIMDVMADLPFKFAFLGDFGLDFGDFVEDGITFAENAFKKAKYCAEKMGMLTLAEDSGILIDALEGELGVQTRRWGAGEAATDQEWIDYFMKKMEGIEDRGAKFVCSACLIGDGVKEGFEGETRGVITDKLTVPILPGLPLSSCFLPEGYDKVYAALGAHEKNQVSHRGRAMKKARDFLEERLV